MYAHFGVSSLISHGKFCKRVQIIFVVSCCSNYQNKCYCFQLLSQSGAGGVDDKINLDVHAINELQNKGHSPTNDANKYSYTSNADGTYSKT